MKIIKILIFILFVTISVTSTFGQNRKRVKINPDQTYDRNDLIVDSLNSENLILEFKLNSYDIVTFDNQEGCRIEANDMYAILEQSAPDLPRFVRSIAIPQGANMQIEVIESEFIEIENIDIIPSDDGNNRDEVQTNNSPVYGDEYKQNQFYPTEIAQLQNPFIIRDVSGQSLHIHPFRYNPVERKLRIYTLLKLRVSGKNQSKSASLAYTSASTSAAFEKIFQEYFINYQPSKTRLKYAPLNDNTNKMLIICYDSFMDEMADFVNWKRQKGFEVEMVAVSTIGNASQIKNYVRNYYNTNGLTFLLLAGDSQQVPTSSAAGVISDNAYGFIVGDDYYSDILVGRFSAETEAQLITQIERTIHYERDMVPENLWLNRAVGVASSYGSNPSDEEHMNTIKSKLNGFGYTVFDCYRSHGRVVAESTLRSLLNSGNGLVNFAGGGREEYFIGVFFNIDNVNALTNTNKLPIVFDVASYNGQFKYRTCFAEAWMRATHNGQPTGAVAFCASTCTQPGTPPITAQKEMNDILTNSYSNNIKRTFAGVAINGMFKMLDVHGSTANRIISGWTIFGDPSLHIRTKSPNRMTVNHSTGIAPGSTSLSVMCDYNGAIVAVSKDNLLIGKSTVSNGRAVVNFSALPSSGTIKLTITGYNKTTYTSNIPINNDLNANFSCDNTSAYTGEAVNFTDLSAGRVLRRQWIFEGGSPSVSNDINPTVIYNNSGTYTVTLISSRGLNRSIKTFTNMVTVSQQPSQTYCDPRSANRCRHAEYISSVEMGRINNNSGCSGYTDFTNHFTYVEAGNTYPLTVKIARPVLMGSIAVWIDWNQDGDFDDADEDYWAYDQTIMANNSQVSISKFNISVPANTTVGKKRMRIRLVDYAYNHLLNPCNNLTAYGEVEDYGINVVNTTTEVPSTLYPSLENVNVTVYPNPASNEVTVQQTGITGLYFIKLINSSGVRVLTQRTTSPSTTINISRLPSGTYILQVMQNARMKSYQLIIR